MEIILPSFYYSSRGGAWPFEALALFEGCYFKHFSTGNCMELAITELECSVENFTLKSFSSVHFLFKRNRKQMEQGGPTCHRTPQALASTLFLRSYRGVTKSSWSYYSLGAPQARTLPGSQSLEQVSSILGLCSASNIRPKLLTRSTETQGSHQKSSAGEPERPVKHSRKIKCFGKGRPW